MAKPIVYIGIDCGVTGAVGVIPPDGLAPPGDLPTAYATPTFVIKNERAGKTSKKQIYDMRGMLLLLWKIKKAYAHCDFRVVVEQQQGRQHDAKSAVFQLGFGQGLWEMACAAMQVFAVENVKPSDWKKKYSLEGKDKEASRYMVQRLYPAVDVSRVKDHDKAEALLLADFLKRHYTGEAYPQPTSRMTTKPRKKNTAGDKNKPTAAAPGKTKRDPKNLPKGKGNIPRDKLRQRK